MFFKPPPPPPFSKYHSKERSLHRIVMITMFVKNYRSTNLKRKRNVRYAIENLNL